MGRWAVAAGLAVGMLLSGAACGGPDGARWGPEAADPPAAAPPAAAPPELAVTPAAGSTGALLSTEIGTSTDGEITEVKLAAKDGDRVSGELRPDGSSWVPDRPLAPSTAYTAMVTAAGADGATTSVETRFTTMPAPGQRTGTGLYLFDGRTYGVAMPVVVEFVEPVPAEARAEVQRRMFVTTDPPQPGVWHWVEDGRQAFYRAPEHWQPGTTLQIRIALDGHPTGDGRYGDADRSATATIGDRLELKVNNATKSMSVLEDGKRTETFPVSLGKPSTPSSSGRMVVMSREEQTVFDTLDELGPVEGYRVDISYALRLTWGGEYIHSAPWSVGDQGVRNVSHGCVNLAPDDAKWLFRRIKVGDPVIVTGTEHDLTQGNGWTAWDMSWEEFVAGSALPIPDELQAAAAKPMPHAVPS
ncbi:MAG: L,D-transpeptidase family protein [Micromonosporaceae bacterium]|nr:L,D-transpeptidase family protein [Micromonosporaceae bacterium]